MMRMPKAVSQLQEQQWRHTCARQSNELSKNEGAVRDCGVRELWATALGLAQKRLGPTVHNVFDRHSPMGVIVIARLRPDECVKEAAGPAI